MLLLEKAKANCCHVDLQTSITRTRSSNFFRRFQENLDIKFLYKIFQYFNVGNIGQTKNLSVLN